MSQENKVFEMLKNQSVQEPPKKENLLKEIVKFAFLAAVIVLPIRIFVAQPFIVSGASMDPTFENGQYLIVDQASYKFKEPKRGDVIIFRYPLDTKKFFIKRIIGLPSETVEIKGGQILIKDRGNNKLIISGEPYIGKWEIRNNQGPIMLKNDEYFVMGDNRDHSSDSRYWGTLKRNLIVGRPLVRLFPLTKISFFPGVNASEIAQTFKI